LPFNFIQHYDHFLERNAFFKDLKDDFNSLHPNPSDRDCIEFNLYKNKLKNRFPDVKCLDQSRIELNLSGGYIHANYVNGYEQENAYIATQSPLDGTIEDFWSMIWQENVRVIVMIAKVDGAKK